MVKMANWCMNVLMFPFVTIYTIMTSLGQGIRRGFRAIVDEVENIYGDMCAGFKVALSKLSVSWIVVVGMIFVLNSLVVGLVPTLTMVAIVAACVGAKYGGRVPRYIRAHVDRIRKSWEKGVDDDDCCAPLPETSLERVPIKLRPRLACKIAVRAIAKVGLLKRSEANSMVYQRVCLDVMESMKMRWHDRLVILPQAVLACLERPEEVEEVMKAIEASCKGRFDVY